MDQERACQPVGLGAVTRCPACAGALEAVSDDDETNLLCIECGRCWHLELGYVSRVNPMTCDGCPHRPVCLSRWHADPAWRPQDRTAEVHRRA